MFPTGFAGAEAQLWLFVVAMIRPGAAFLAAPVFSAAQVPVQLRLILALAIGIPATASVQFQLPVDGVASIAGVVLILGETLVGLALGFAVQIGFSAALIGGELIGNTMGLGFANFFDPMSGTSTQALGTFVQILGTFLFLALGGHLMLAAIVVQSYTALPPGAAWLSPDAIHGVVLFGSDLFAAGLAIALPVSFALVLVQLVMGMLARSAPALNIFAVGLPATLLAGVVLLVVSAPAIGEGITAALMRGLDMAQMLAMGKGGG